MRHDDFCPCARFRAQPEFCRCGAVEREEIVSDTARRFADRLKAIDVCTDATLKGGESFPQPRRKDGEEPCGESHTQPGETCDICGASSAALKGGEA